MSSSGSGARQRAASSSRFTTYSLLPVNNHPKRRTIGPSLATVTPDLPP
jgi:hypothetical protein